MSGGPIASAISSAQVNFGDYQNGISNDETYIAPTASSYVEVTTPSIYNSAQTIGTFGAVATTAQDFYVWTVGTVATPIDLYAMLVDDGTGTEPGGSWGGTATPLSGSWTVQKVSGGTTVATFKFTGDANTSGDGHDPNAVLVGAITPGTASSPNGYSIQFGAPVITPEPGSLVAMFSGLVGLVGFGIRRRK